jgi:hypothetical protein
VTGNRQLADKKMAQDRLNQQLLPASVQLNGAVFPARALGLYQIWKWNSEVKRQRPAE